MLNFMVNAEGGLTTAGYAICIVLGIVVSGWIYIWNAPVFTGAIRTFSVPGML